MKTIAEFLDYVEDHTDPSACWIWIGGMDGKRKRYGRANVRGEPTSAHRASWIFHFGTISGDWCVLHTCDVTRCVNPKHLYLGTQKNNAQDRETRGRGNHAAGARHFSRTMPERVARGDKNGSRTKPERLKRGEANARAKMTEDGVRALRALHAAGASKRSLARVFGVAKSVASDAIVGKTWAHVR